MWYVLVLSLCAAFGIPHTGLRFVFCIVPSHDYVLWVLLVLWCLGVGCFGALAVGTMNTNVLIQLCLCMNCS